VTGRTEVAPQGRPLYRVEREEQCICANVHNVDGKRGNAGAATRIPRIEPGESLVVAELDGPAVIDRFWLTLDWPDHLPYPGSTLRNRAVYLECFWDGADTPAVLSPLGDFFCHPLCYDMPFENSLFSDPSGRSFLTFVPMPFRRHATIKIVNDYSEPITVFHDIRFRKKADLGPDDAYFHACFNRTVPIQPAQVHEILPRTHGKGRYLGTHMGIITDPFNPLPWHNGNLGFYFDGDQQFPSMLGASLDDVFGSSWAYDKRYVHQDSGLPLTRYFAEGGGGHYGLYGYHRRDPLYFTESCSVSIRPQGGTQAPRLLRLLKESPGLIDRMSLPFTVRELEEHVEAGESFWVDCGRMDDMATVALYYLDHPEGSHSLADVEERCAPSWNWPAKDAARYLDDLPY
jgi:hypothetical protein